MSPTPRPARRRLLGAGAATALAAFLGIERRALATIDDVERAIARFGDGVAPEDGTITLTTPEIAENGNGVPVSFAVESPMTAGSHVAAVMILATDNPNAEVATFRFTPASGAARAATRMRLARTQRVIAIARLSDGSLRRTSVHVRVTVGGCGA